MTTNLFSEFIMEQFSNMFNSYTKSFNKAFGRKGKLFMDHSKRIEITDEASFSKIIHYIHANSVHHGYCRNIPDWTHSGYSSFLSNAKTNLLRDEVLGWFGGKEGFIRFHQQGVTLKNLEGLAAY
jgi:putative transposase